MDEIIELPTPFRKKRKKQPRRINGKRYRKQNPRNYSGAPTHAVYGPSGAVISKVTGWGVTARDIASARAMALGLPHLVWEETASEC